MRDAASQVGGWWLEEAARQYQDDEQRHHYAYDYEWHHNAGAKEARRLLLRLHEDGLLDGLHHLVGDEAAVTTEALS
jgi:hypothetical protein